MLVSIYIFTKYIAYIHYIVVYMYVTVTGHSAYLLEDWSEGQRKGKLHVVF
jgi:hypothetical protein